MHEGYTRTVLSTFTGLSCVTWFCECSVYICGESVGDETLKSVGKSSWLPRRANWQRDLKTETSYHYLVKRVRKLYNSCKQTFFLDTQTRLSQNLGWLWVQVSRLTKFGSLRHQPRFSKSRVGEFRKKVCLQKLHTLSFFQTKYRYDIPVSTSRCQFDRREALQFSVHILAINGQVRSAVLNTLYDIIID